MRCTYAHALSQQSEISHKYSVFTSLHYYSYFNKHGILFSKSCFKVIESIINASVIYND